MKIDTALILGAGFGKRLNPITLHTPKPLLKIKNLTLLDHCINLIEILKINMFGPVNQKIRSIFSGQNTIFWSKTK